MNDKGNLDIGGNRLHRRTLSGRRFLTNSGAVLSGGALALATPYIGTAAADEPLRIGMVLAKQGAFAQQGADLAAGGRNPPKDPPHNALTPHTLPPAPHHSLTATA